MPSHAWSVAALVATLVGASGCTIIGSPTVPLTTVEVASRAPAPGTPLVIVLPGFMFDADDLLEAGVAEAIHRGWPEADVMLVGATFPYYRAGVLVERLHADVVRPARERGYREIWLAGGSMGGMGTLLYEWSYPGALEGIVLISPFLGGDALLDEIRAAGLERWEPGPLAAAIDGENYQRQVWKMVQGWRRQPGRAARVWLACGTEDRLYRDADVLGRELLPGQYLVGPGDHDWAYWLPAIERTFTRIASARTRGAHRK